MKKPFKLLLTVCFVLSLTALNTSYSLSSLYSQIESLALQLVPDEIEHFISALSEKLA